MKLCKVEELSHIALCYAVCKAEMPHLKWGETIGIHHASHQIVVPELPAPDCFSPFLNWKMFGPILEREGIGFTSEARDNSLWKAQLSYTREVLFSKPTRLIHTYCLTRGDSALIAAIRCFLTTRFGNYVSVPQELLP